MSSKKLRVIMTDLIHFATGSAVGYILTDYMTKSGYYNDHPEAIPINIGIGVGMGIIASLVPNLDNDKDITTSWGLMPRVAKFLHLDMDIITGHRRFMHSIPFAFIFSLLVSFAGMFRNPLFFWIPFICIMLHLFLDMFNEFGICLFPLPACDVRYDLESKYRVSNDIFSKIECGKKFIVTRKGGFYNGMAEAIPHDSLTRKYTKLYQYMRIVSFQNQGKWFRMYSGQPIKRTNFIFAGLVTGLLCVILRFGCHLFF